MTLPELIEELSEVPIVAFPSRASLDLATALVKEFQRAVTAPPPAPVVVATVPTEPLKRKRGRPPGSMVARR